MYSLFPALICTLFLGYGIYSIAKKGINRLTISLLLVCLTTFFWQASCAVLFQLSDTTYVNSLIRFGYLFVLVLPTTLYHFSVEISKSTHERRWVYASYAATTVLAGFDIFSNLIIDGHYHYFFGYYPKAGALYPIYILQTIVTGFRTLYLIWQKRLLIYTQQKMRALLRSISVLVYCMITIDYLCAYGLELYSLNIAVIPISLGLIAIALTRYEVTASVAVASIMAHEIRTPLVSIRMLADGLAKHLPELHKGYQLAIEHGLIASNIRPAAVQLLADISCNISHNIEVSNTIIDMMLAYARMEPVDTRNFAWHSMHECVKNTLNNYPFELNDRKKVTLIVDHDFEFYGSIPLFKLVLFNLIKNALYALKVARKGSITITLAIPNGQPTLTFKDTGCGIPVHVLPYIFDIFFTTQPSTGYGLGLPFCRRVIAESNGHIDCFSKEKEYTSFVLVFPPSPNTLKLHKDSQATVDRTYSAYENTESVHNLTPSENTNSAKAPSHKNTMQPTGKTVILAEDDVTNREMMLIYLESCGFKVLAAENGQQVLNYLNQGIPIDLILMDIQMPVLNGIQAATVIRSKEWRYQNVPILALSGNSDPITTSTVMNDHILKTGEMQVLHDKISAILFNTNLC